MRPGFTKGISTMLYNPQKRQRKRIEKRDALRKQRKDLLSKDQIQQIVDSNRGRIAACIEGEECSNKALLLTDRVILRIDEGLCWLDMKIKGVAWMVGLVDAALCREFAAGNGVDLVPFGKGTLPLIVMSETQWGEAFLKLLKDEVAA